MTYMSFLVLFVLVPVLGLFFVNLRLYKKNLSELFFNLKGILLLCLLAFFYTTPWDNYLVAESVWWYGPDRVLGTLGYVPIEEYLFFILQTLLTGLWTALVLRKMPADTHPITSSFVKNFILSFLFFIWFQSLFTISKNSYFYMNLILSWALPILILQFFIGGKWLLSNLKVFFVCFGLPSLYLFYADFFALKNGIWEISKVYTTGLHFQGLPVEEALFFLITNLMITQGLILFHAMRPYFLNNFPRFKRYV